MVARLLTISILIGLASSSLAAEPMRFRFEAGQVIRTELKQTTSVEETTLDENSNLPRTGTSRTELNLVRQWRVLEVSDDGTATMEMSIVRMRTEIERPGPKDENGQFTKDTVVIDSTVDGLKAQTDAFMNKPIVTAKFDSLGRLVDTKTELETVSVARIKAELPFRVVFPEQPLEQGKPWQRELEIKLDPPFGAGESFPAKQTYVLKEIREGVAVIGVSTELKESPEDPTLKPAIVPMLWSGEVYFQPATGRYLGSRLQVKDQVADHQGEGSKFVYESQFEEKPAGK